MEIGGEHAGQYLPPQLRNLKSGQIGLSSHKNEFTHDTLISNWYEDKIKNVEQEPPSNKKMLNFETTTGSTHKELPLPKPEKVFPAEGVPKDLIFAHHAIEDNSRFFTVNDCTINTPGVKTGLVFADKTKIRVVEQKTSLAEKKKAGWEKEKMELIDTQQHYITTKTIDSIPLLNQQQQEKEKGVEEEGKKTQLMWGDFTRETQKYLKEIQQLNLRKPVTLVVSPFATQQQQQPQQSKTQK